jgi:hypothetical protein
MKASEIFGVVVRTIGLVVIIYGLWNMIGGCDNFIENLLQPDSEGQYASTFSYFAFGVPSFLFGAVCFFLADWIVGLAYREATS